MEPKLADNDEHELICSRLNGKYLFCPKVMSQPVLFEDFPAFEAFKIDGNVKLVFGLEEGELDWVRGSPCVWLDDKRGWLTNGESVSRLQIYLSELMEDAGDYFFTEEIEERRAATLVNLATDEEVRKNGRHGCNSGRFDESEKDTRSSEDSKEQHSIYLLCRGVHA